MNDPNCIFCKIVRGEIPAQKIYDDAEVVSGLKEGDQVALVAVAELQAQRTQQQNNLRQRMSSGTPGVGVGGGGRGGGGGR